MASSAAAAVVAVLVIVLLGMGWPAPASAEGTRTACKDCNSTCASSINFWPPQECGRGPCGAPVPECVEECVTQCSRGCTPSPGMPDSCYRMCSGINTRARCRRQCCPSAQQCEEITESAMKQCVDQCGATCRKGCGHS